MTRQELSGSRIKDEMASRHLRRKDLREMLHYANDTQISPILKGRQALTEHQAEILAKEWNIRKEYILGMDECRTEDDLISKEFSNYKTTLSYFKSLGYEFRACYVWDASAIAVAMGYQIMAPYLAGESTTDPLDEIFPESKQDLLRELFEFSKNLNYSNTTFGQLYNKASRAIDCISEHYDDYGYGVGLLADFDRIGIFELCQNPLDNENFQKKYYESLKSLGLGTYDLKLLSSRMLDLNSLGKSSIISERYHDSAKLRGCLYDSVVELRFALSKNGILQSYVPFDDMRRIFATVDNTSAAIIGSMLKCSK